MIHTQNKSSDMILKDKTIELRQLVILRIKQYFISDLQPNGMGNQCCSQDHQQKQEYPATSKTQDITLVPQCQQILSNIHPVIRLIFQPINTNNSMQTDGALISPHLVLTSAQDVYNRQSKAENNKSTYKVYLGDHKNLNDYYEVEDWRYLEAFKTAEKGKEGIFNYALLKLKPNDRKPINIRKYFDISLPCQCLLNQDLKDHYRLSEKSISKSNFLQKRKMQPQKYMRQFLYEACQQQDSSQSSKIIVLKQERKIAYLSGYPIVFDNKIIAIHLKGDSNNQSYERLVTVNMIDQLVKWSQELNSPISFQPELQCSHIRDKMEVLKEESLQAAKGLMRLAREYLNQENHSAALDKYVKAITIMVKLKTGETSEIIKALLEMGKIYKRQGNYLKTHQVYSKALQLQRKIKGSQGQEASILDQIAEAYYLQQIHLQAIKTYIQSLGVKEQFFGKDSMEAVDTLLTIGNIYQTKQRFQKAQEYILQAFQITQKTKGTNSIQAARICYYLANVSYRRKEYPKAVQIYQQALSIFARLDRKPKYYANAQLNLGNTYCKMKQYKLAAQSYQGSLSSFKQQKMEEDVTKSARKLAKCLKILKQVKRFNQVIAQYKIDAQTL